MRKLIFVLMPICVVLALFSYALSKDINFTMLINGLSTLDLKSFDYSKITQAFNNLNFSDTWGNIANIWSNVDGLVSFFSAIGDTFVIFFSDIIDFFKAVYNIFIFFYEFGRYLFLNLFELIKYLFNYIFS